jgi:hypothetical protein
VSEPVIHHGWCPHCKKRVKPMIADALPGARVNHRTLVLSAWLHYGLGNSLSPIVEVFHQRQATTEQSMHARKRHDSLHSR